MITIIRFLKKYIDKLYYGKYTLGEKDALIRTMFPGITRVGEYSKISGFLKLTSPTELDQIIGVITSFYWGEVARLTSIGKGENLARIERYQGLMEFCQALRDYSAEETISSNNKQ